MTNSCAILAATFIFPLVAFANEKALQRELKEELNEELKAISFVETSGGRNLNHRRLERGIHKGTHAGGFFGIMPLTARFVISHSPYLRQRYGSWLERSNDEITEELNHNRIMDYEIAIIHWRRLRSRFTDPSVAAYAWNHGWGMIATDRIEEIHEDAYVERFKEYYEKVLDREPVDQTEGG